MYSSELELMAKISRLEDERAVLSRKWVRSVSQLNRATLGSQIDDIDARIQHLKDIHQLELDAVYA